jgi:predicted transcriptional regulator
MKTEPTIYLRLPADLRRQLEDLAESRGGQKLTALCKQAVAEFVLRHHEELLAWRNMRRVEKSG